MPIYSPIHSITYNGLSVDIKRDDLIDPYISGNKWRKLKYILQDVFDQRKTHLVTFGGAYSNHLVATAAAAARNGLQATAFVRGEKVDNEMLLLCKLYGMKLLFTDRESYKDKIGLFKEHFSKDGASYFIDEGGASEFALKGCAEIVQELTKPYDHIFCAAGTGTTASGLKMGIDSNNLPAQLNIIPVLKNGGFIGAELEGNGLSMDNVKLHLEYHFGGYAKTDSELLLFMKNFVASTGILVDPVYTAKLFYAVFDLNQMNYFKSSDKILILHTGGLLGTFGMKQKIAEMFS